MNLLARDRINPKGPGGAPVSMVRVAPRGDRVACVVDSGPEAGLYVWEPAGAKRIVAIEDFTIEDLAWSPDGDHLAYLRGGGPPGSYGEVGWASRQAPGELGRASAVSFAWTPKSNALILADPFDKALVRKPIAGPDRQSLAPLPDDFDPQNAPKIALSFDGALIAATCRRAAEDVSEVWIVERKSAGVERRVLTQIPGASAIVRPLWAPRTATIALYIVHLEQEKSAIVAVPRLEGEGIILYESDFIEPAERPAWSPTGRTIALFGVEKPRNEFTRSGPPRLVLVTNIAEERPAVVPVTEPDEMCGGLTFLDERRIAVDGGEAAHVLTFSDPV